MLCLPRFWAPQDVEDQDDAPQDDTDADVSSLTSVDSVLPSGGEEDRDSASGTGQRVHVEYGGWQTFLPMTNCTPRVMLSSQTACHRGWSPLPNLLPSLLPKLPNLC